MRLPAVLALGLAVTAAPVPALACAVYSPLKPEAVRGADVVVVGRLSNFRREASARSRRAFEENRHQPRPAWLPPGRDQGPARDLTSFDVAVEQVAKGRAPARIHVAWHMSNISPPERIRSGRYLIGLSHPPPERRLNADFIVLGHVCSGAYIYPAGGRKAVAALRVLAGKPPYPPDPPRPPEPEPSLSDMIALPEPAPVTGPAGYPDEVSLLDRIPPGYRVMLGGAAAGLFVGVSALLWRRRKDEEAE